MTIRIYALAKQLKKTSKELLEVCPKLGINGKVNQLASLSTDEIARISEYFSSMSDQSAKSVEQPVMIAPKNIPTSGEKKIQAIPVIKTPRPGGISRIFGVSSKQAATRQVADSVEGDGPEDEKTKKVKGKAADKEAEEKVVQEVREEKEKTVDSLTAAEPVDSSDSSDQKGVVESGEVSSETQQKKGKPKSAAKASKVEDAAKTAPEKQAASKEETPDEVVQEKKSAESKPLKKKTAPESGTQSGASPKKTQTIQPAISRRDSKRASGRNQAKSVVETRPARPIPPAFAQPDRTQILEEMKRPPMITPPAESRIVVLGANQKKSSNGSSASRSNTGTSNVTIGRLAHMPDAPSRPATKKTKEPEAQKPVRVLTPDVIDRARVAGVSVTDVLKVPKRDTSRSPKVNDKNKPARGPIDIGTNAPAGDLVTTERRRTKNYRSRDVEGQDARSRRSSSDSRRSRNLLHSTDEDDFGYVSRARGLRQSRRSNVAVTLARVNDIVIETPCTVKDFSGATGVGVAVVIKELMKLGMMKTMNQTLDKETIELLIMSFNLKATVKEQATLEEQYVDAVINEADPPESLIPRAPVVTFLGHVDHGKTSLLDRILNLHVVSGEKGGITQHIRTYRIDTPGGAVTFVDTPGHEAFTEMRARGANCTDIAVLVVAADDGVMPQTEEAISHAKAAGVPIIVALNKMDLPGVKRDKVIQELANNDLTPSEWGGDVEIVETSAITGMGVDTLLDTILTVAELSELKANPDRAADGVVLEAALQSGEGVVCKALVQNGTLHNGDVVLCGASYGRVRSMTDTLDPHKRLKEAGPSVPVTLVGLDVAPEAGSKFIVLEDVSVARQIAEERAKRARAIELAGTPSHVTLENLFERMNSAKAQQTLNVIIRADVRGSIEAIRKEMSKLEHPEVKVKILQATVGGITEADVYLADASDAIIAGFNVVPDEGARALAETKKVQIRRYDIIYKLTEDIKAALEGMLRPIEQVKELGRALVQRTFNISRVGVIAGCRVLYGTIERDSQVRVIRDSRVIGEYALDTLRREKDDVKEVREGYECGIKLKNFNDVKEGDILEAYKIEEVARTF